MSTEAVPGSHTRVPPAPLDAREVALALAPFGSSRMLPKAAYLDPEVLGWERRHVFSGWVCLGRADDVTDPRSAAAYDLGETGVLVTRDDDGALRAFENACRHRGHELLPCGGIARTKTIVCPYHAWTYEYDGTLRNAPRFPRDGSFDTSTRGLVGMPVRDWNGWLFVDPSGSADSFGLK